MILVKCDRHSDDKVMVTFFTESVKIKTKHPILRTVQLCKGVEDCLSHALLS